MSIPILMGRKGTPLDWSGVRQRLESIGVNAPSTMGRAVLMGDGDNRTSLYAAPRLSREQLAAIGFACVDVPWSERLA